MFVLGEVSRPARDLSPPPSFFFVFQASSCCCAPRDKFPVTRTIKRTRTRTKVVIRRKTVTRSVVVNRRSVAEMPVEPIETEPIEIEPIEIDSPVTVNDQDADHGLFARNLCPRCPSGRVVLPAHGKTSGGGEYSYCCPARSTRTIKRTTWRTKTIRRTKTVIKTVKSVGLCAAPLVKS